MKFRTIILVVLIAAVFAAIGCKKKEEVAKEPIKVGAILDGLLLSPLQAIIIIYALVVVLPRILSREAADILRPGRILISLLAVSALVFGYFALVKIPTMF